jgi:serine/threonine protein kinase
VEWVSVMTAAALKMDSIDEGTNSDELPPGTRLLLGQFTIESFVNSGGFGIVYIARDSLSRRVVVKECFPSSFCRRIGTSVGARSRAQQEDFRSVVKLFLQEAITLSQLDHPNIVKVHQVFEDNSTAYIAMEFVDGPDLLQTVEGTAPALKPDEIVRFLDKMLDAVGYVHAQGLLHRDISPDNILLDKATGQPVLIDFGASRKDVTRQSRALSGLRVVKDGYSPQEFYVSGSKQAPCSDLYALAATFYHLISGESPKTSQERLSAIAGREPDPLPRLSGRIKGYPAGFLAAIDKAMALFPRDRLQSVDDWRAMMHADPALPALAARPSKQSVPSAPAPAAIPDADATPALSRTVSASREASQPTTSTPAGRGMRDLLISSTAAILLLVGLLALPLPDDLTASPAPAAVAAVTASPPAEAAQSAEALVVTNVLRLPSGLAFETIETATGTQTVVAEVPDGVVTNLQVGDVLLVYAASGEPLGTPNALREILKREFANGVTTYSFVIRRSTSTMDAEFRLQVAG